MSGLSPSDQIRFIGVFVMGTASLARGISIYVSSRKITAQPFILGMVTAVRRDENNDYVAVVEYRNSGGEKQKHFWKCLSMPSLGQSVKLALSPDGGVEVAEKGHHAGRALLLIIIGLGCLTGSGSILFS